MSPKQIDFLRQWCRYSDEKIASLSDEEAWQIIHDTTKAWERNKEIITARNERRKNPWKRWA
jgi:hypothetical protein